MKSDVTAFLSRAGASVKKCKITGPTYEIILKLYYASAYDRI